MDRQELEKRMDRIIDWVKVCDTKTSIMLSVIAVLLTIVFTSDIAVGSISEIVMRMFDRQYCFYDGINVIGIFSLLLLLITCVTSIVSIVHFVKVLYAKTNEKQFGDQHFTDSLIHFHHISSMEFNEFVNEMNAYSDVSWNQDLLSQIHINAKRCNEKFNDYNEGIRWLSVSAVCGLLTAVLVSLYFIIY